MRTIGLLSAAALWIGAFVVLPGAEAREKKKDAVPGQETMKGYVVDRMCATGMVKRGAKQAMERAARHTKMCALEEGCRESGYGLVSEGKFYKFDANGDRLALEYLERTSIERGHWVVVRGTMDGSIFKVTSLEEEGKDQKGKGGSKEAKPKL